MYKQFWEDKGAFIQFVGIIATVAALLLSIKVPKDEAGINALINLQFTALVVVTASLIAMCLTFIGWIFKYTINNKGKFLQNILIMAICLGSFWEFINDLYSYALSINHEGTIRMSVIILLIIMSVANKIAYEYRLKTAILDKKIWYLIQSTGNAGLGLALTNVVTEPSSNKNGLLSLFETKEVDQNVIFCTFFLLSLLILIITKKRKAKKSINLDLD